LIEIIIQPTIDHKESEEKLFKLVVRKYSDGDTIVRHFNPVPVTDEHFIWNSESWLDDDFYQIIKDCSIIDTEEISIQDLMLLR
jgi:hypothetical protein